MKTSNSEWPITQTSVVRTLRYNTDHSDDTYGLRNLKPWTQTRRLPYVSTLSKLPNFVSNHKPLSPTAHNLQHILQKNISDIKDHEDTKR